MHSKVRISYIFPSNLYAWNKFSDSIFSFFFFFFYSTQLIYKTAFSRKHCASPSLLITTLRRTTPPPPISSEKHVISKEPQKITLLALLHAFKTEIFTQTKDTPQKHMLGLQGSRLQSCNGQCSVVDPNGVQLSQALLLGCFLLTKDNPRPRCATRSQFQSYSAAKEVCS